jgi:protein required for attachment to host cells
MRGFKIAAWGSASEAKLLLSPFHGVRRQTILAAYFGSAAGMQNFGRENMTKVNRIPTSALVIVCDARRAIFLRNNGAPIRPELAVEAEISRSADEASRKSDRPGRRPDRVSSGGEKGPLSAMEEPDWQRRDADRFAADICLKLEAALNEKGANALIVAAAPEMLGMLRKHMPEGVRQKIISEIDKDLTNVPRSEIVDTIFEY